MVVVGADLIPLIVSDKNLTFLKLQNLYVVMKQGNVWWII